MRGNALGGHERSKEHHHGHTREVKAGPLSQWLRCGTNSCYGSSLWPEAPLSYGANACRWIIPFSRQFLSSAICLTPLIPWAWKMALVKAWLTQCYYKPCHLEHLIPTGGPKDMNYTG